LKTNRGFTLIEVLVTAGILACGLVAVAAVFSFVVQTNNFNRQMAVATTLLSDKMEEFRAASFTDSIWMNVAGSETVVVEGERYVRVWRIGANTPKSLTVIVYSERNLRTRRQTELIRATTLVSPTF
jgi:prepilin-type N-terminal cleavage/methylation domain-containing protein